MTILKDKNILVTGSKGFVGKYLIRELKKNNTLNIIEIDKNESIDITNWIQLKEFIQGKPNIDVIFHLAAIVFIPYTIKNPRITYNVNTFGTLNILELARIYDIKKIIFSSTYVYGNPQYLPIDENHPIQPLNPYTHSKVLAEQLLKIYHDDYGIASSILRPFNIYGFGQNDNFLIPTIISQLRSNKIILNDSKPKRDFIYISDVVDAYIKACQYEKPYEIFNIGSGVSYSVKNLVNQLINIHGRNVPVAYKNIRRSGEIHNIIADYSKARSKLNWEPVVPINKGLKLYYKEYNNKFLS